MRPLRVRRERIAPFLEGTMQNPFTFKDLVGRVRADKKRYLYTDEWMTILCWWVYICRTLEWYDEAAIGSLWHYAPEM